MWLLKVWEIGPVRMACMLHYFVTSLWSNFLVSLLSKFSKIFSHFVYIKVKSRVIPKWAGVHRPFLWAGYHQWEHSQPTIYHLIAPQGCSSITQNISHLQCWMKFGWSIPTAFWGQDQSRPYRVLRLNCLTNCSWAAALFW